MPGFQDAVRGFRDAIRDSWCICGCRQGVGYVGAHTTYTTCIPLRVYLYTNIPFPHTYKLYA